MFVIKETDADIFNTTCRAVVNPVNCNGVAGKGLAFEFRQRYPDNHEVYKVACKSGYLRIGVVLPFTTPEGLIIYNFPTKLNWWQSSELLFIKEGLQSLIDLLDYSNVSSIAIPALGCGLGGLDWLTVRSEIINKFTAESSRLKHFHRLELYPPR